MSRGKPFAPVARGNVRGVPPTLEWVAVERLRVDPDYQRAVDGSNSRKIIVGMVKQWDWALCQPLVVSRRADGSMFILDGQHRHSGAKERGDIPHLPCVVLTDRTAQDEAEAFVALNTKRQKLSQTDIFNGMLAAGDEDAKRVASIIDETGWKIARSSNAASYGPGHLSCAPLLARSLNSHGEAAVRNSLTALREAYPNEAFNVAATLLKALLLLYRDNRLAHLDPDSFIESLGSVPPNEWADESQDYRRSNPTCSHTEALAEAMLLNAREFALAEAA